MYLQNLVRADFQPLISDTHMDALAGLLLVVMGLGGMAAVAFIADALTNKEDYDDFTF